MRGKNPIRPPVIEATDLLDIQSIFPTLQGEGPNTGVPSVFLRLGGCNLACSFCDTEFESFSAKPLADIISEIKKLAEDKSGIRVKHLVVITGGEPLRQPIEPLCKALLKEGFKVQIETNGTLYRDLPEEIEIVCSPKNTGTGYYPIRQDLLKRVNAIKFIVSHSNPLYREIAEVGQGAANIPVYIQPMDEYDIRANADNVAYATSLAMQHGYRLSLQIHKILGIE